MKKQALLIGINQYQILPGLKYARQDAEAVADSLKQNYCFSDKEILLLTDAKPGFCKPTSRYIIQEHLEKLANQDLDLFIFGFWGHGLFRNGKRYLCPLDVMGNRAELQGMPFDELQEFISKIHAKNTCMILDCCQTIHDRGEAETLTISDQTSMENAARDIVLRRKEQIPDFQSNVAILNSCKEGQASYEWDERKHGLFTAHLLDAMKKRSSSVMQIASYISSNIEKTALELGKEQTPFYKLEGDIVLPVETKSTPLVTGDVFISYRHCNADLVKPVEAELKRRGISYFIDRIGINYGMDYSEALTIAIGKCKLLLLFWTPEVKGSDDIVNEVVLAQRLKKTVVPYKIGNFSEVEHPKLCYHIARFSAYSVPQQTQDSVTELVNRIQQILDPSAPIPPGPVLQSEPAPTPPDSNNPQNKAGERKTVTVKGVEFAFRWCPAGTFIMGSPISEDGRKSDEKQHQVTLSSGFWMMETPVTQEQWTAIMSKNPSYFEGDDLPVENVTLNNCKKFCKKCTDLGLSVQLPTEAQWEYACRAESTTAYNWGKALKGDRANCNGNYPYGTTTQGKNIGKTTSVGSYKPNEWGLFDMHGNVWEWCEDKYGDYPDEEITDPTGPLRGPNRVIRGGSWRNTARRCRSADRGSYAPEFSKANIGFRCVCLINNLDEMQFEIDKKQAEEPSEETKSCQPKSSSKSSNPGCKKVAKKAAPKKTCAKAAPAPKKTCAKAVPAPKKTVAKKTCAKKAVANGTPESKEKSWVDRVKEFFS